MTQLIRDLSRLQQLPTKRIVTIGNFDGVHLGHQALLRHLVAKARAQKVPAMVMSFEPHPQTFFAGSEAAPRLTSFREKFLLLAAQQIDILLLIRFNAQFAELSATDFIQSILHKTCRASHVIVGDDFYFGKNRTGDFSLLQQQNDFTVERMPAFFIDNERVSSSGIRQFLAAGDFDSAAKWLGRPWMMSGRVMYGAARGRTLGFPTANISIGHRLVPVAGVYTVRVHGIAKNSLPGVANVGIRPTVDGTKQILEVYLLNFSKNIYGQSVSVEFCSKLRDEIRFSNIDALKKQIHDDVVYARQYFILRGEKNV